MNSENPYLRLRSYTETDAQYFKGRETESGEIFDLLQRNDVVVLYSESAEGKSSILAAGLYPRLRRHNFLPVSIVFTEDEFAAKSPDFDALILGRIRQAMAEANPGGREPLAPDFGRKVNESECFEWVSTSDVEMPQDSESAAALTGSAWWMLRDFAIERYGVRVCPVLVFDQFEEVFTRASSAWTDAFFGWLERLFSDNVPEAVGKALDAFPEDEEPEFSTRKDFRTIVSMRNEYMGELDYWGVQRHFLPEFKNSRYCLRALTIDEAEEVLDLRFADRPELKKSVLAALSGVPASKLAEAQRDLPMVPAMLLSVVCGVLCEEKSAQKYLDNLKDGNSAAVDNILWDFYRTSMRECRIGPTTREYIENVLVDKGGKRVRTKVDSKALRRIGFRDKILPQLKKKGLVKTSRINGEDYVEIVHDRLAAIIEKSRTRRSNWNQRVATMFIVILACLIMLFLGTRQQLYSDTLENHPFAQLNNSGARELTIEDQSCHLENNSFIRNAHIINTHNYYNYVDVQNCLNLDTLTLSTNKWSEYLKVTISACPNLRVVQLEGDSLWNVGIETDESFILLLNPELRHLDIKTSSGTPNEEIHIIPSSEKSELGIINFEIMNGILFNNFEQQISYIYKGYNSSKFQGAYFPFPDHLLQHQSLMYGPYKINNDSYNISQNNLHLKFNPDSTKLKRNRTPFYSGHVDLNQYENLESIDFSSFSNCNLSSISFPNNIKKIESAAFSNCKNLQFLELPDSLEVIDSNAFSGCSNLEKLKINSHTRISNNSFPIQQISDVEISHVPGAGNDSLHLCAGAVLNRYEEPVLLTKSFLPSAEFAEKTGWKYANGALYAPNPAKPTRFYNVSTLQEMTTDYIVPSSDLLSSEDVILEDDNLFFIPLSNNSEINIYSSAGKKIASQNSVFDIYFNNYIDKDSAIYINPCMYQSNIYFAISPDSIKEIHLPFGEPYKVNNLGKTVREIMMTEEQMMNTVLYVPYGCADNYHIPEYKWFKEIREDSWIERYMAPLRASMNGFHWNRAIFIIICFLLLTLFVSYNKYRKHKTESFKQLMIKNSLIVLNSILLFIIPFLTFFYVAVSYGCSTEFAGFISGFAAFNAIMFVGNGPKIIRFVSRIFNRYVIDPLALLFH